jgi:hypothetical protein
MAEDEPQDQEQPEQPEPDPAAPARYGLVAAGCVSPS